MADNARVLALEAYYAGSHRYFLDGWSARSRHRFTKLTLPGHHWKWRMRHAALTFSEDVNQRVSEGQSWDVVFCTDMLCLAEFRGLVAAEVARLPHLLYFHENQLTYPFRHSGERDYHFAFSNFISAAAADEIWFNSSFHRDDFLTAMEALLKRMPDRAPMPALKRIEQRSTVQTPAVESIETQADKSERFTIAWAARWEHDKGAELFFAALRQIKQLGVSFQLIVLGEQFHETPAVFSEAEKEFAEEIVQWGYLEQRDDYLRVLGLADVLVSSAQHEFFGITVCEAALMGVIPILPQRLSYPELLGTSEHCCFYDGSEKGLADKILQMGRLTSGERTQLSDSIRRRFDKFTWPNRIPDLDRKVEEVAKGCLS